MSNRGAGGTRGGVGRFFLGLAMMIAGGYLFLSSIKIVNNFSMGYSLYRIGDLSLTSGMVLVPFIFGIGLIFYNSKNFLGWLLATASLLMLLFGVIASINFRLAPMSAFELITILVLAVGGGGIFLSSLQDLQ
ncbi:hypothetical protein C1752_00043 [Acaryochloris thomasi RCC1774]|uniref:Uncharacterized protein n=1 Tax=Acaryochloris thomasi RCC1774 TaxID=1764569 RepID=A0A2W1JQ23_9CYAN|nr:hypothetical protein [Acaryochloris thomasi]PZD75423.1 hypothetical protein C1752_00043 [Acaryochloris thomasi RCC1774]